MNCIKNKNKKIIIEYRSLIGEQAKLIVNQKEQIEKLESNIE